jgi:hypothetical protein
MTPRTERMLRAYLSMQLAPAYAVVWIVGFLAVALLAAILYAVAVGIFDWFQYTVLGGR